MSRAKYVVAKVAAGKHQVLEVIEHGLGRRVEIGVDFIGHNLTLFVKLAVREAGVADKVGNQFSGSRQIAGGENAVNDGFFLGGVGVQFAAHGLHAVDDMPGRTAVSALEYCVLDKVGETTAVITFVAAAHVHSRAAVAHGTPRHMQMHHPQARWSRVIRNFKRLLHRASVRRI